MYSYEKKSIALKVFHQTNSVSETIRILGYPTRRQLYSWIDDENLPSKERKPLPRIANSPEHHRNPPLDVKLDAIKRCFEHGDSIICHSNRELLYHPKNITKRLVVVHAKRLASQQLFLPERFCIYDLMIRKRF